MATGVNYSHKYYINGLDLWRTFGIVVEAGNLAELERVPNRKEQWMNNWPDENGAQRYTDKSFFESKTMNLSFVFICDNKAEYLRNSNRFKEFITVGGASGYFELDCILNGKKYKLLYSGNDSVEVLTPINNYPFANAVARYSFNVIDDLLTGVNGGDSNMLDTDQFVSVWDTRNVSAGSSAADTVTLPLVAGVSNFTIDWGDGTALQTVTNNVATHKYTTAGEYTIKCKGIVKGFRFNNSGDLLKLLKINSWGDFEINNTGIFYGCSRLNLNKTSGIPLITQADMSYTFAFCAVLTSIENLPLWDTSKVTLWSNSFNGTTSYQQDISSLNTTSVLAVNNMFLNSSLNQELGKWSVSKIINASGFMSAKTPATFSSKNLDSIYLSWSKQNLQRNVTISFGTAKYSASGKVGRDILTNKFNWTITDGGII